MQSLPSYGLKVRCTGGVLETSVVGHHWGDKPYVPNNISLHDETLRDGLQSPSIKDPTLEEKIKLLHSLDALGVGSVNVGLPAAGPRALEDTTRLCQEIADSKLAILPCIAARTKPSDIAPAVDVTQKTGVPLRVMAFIGCSPIRIYAESWTLEILRKLSVDAVDFAVKEGLKITYVTEDTTRSRPDTLVELFRAVIDHGADRLCLCDTCGHATPDGAMNLVRFTRHIVSGCGRPIGIDWHGHDDRGLALANAIAAASEGADRLHGCVLGIGERVGNTALDMLLVNRALEHGLDPNLDRVLLLCEQASRAMGRPIPADYPLRLLSEAAA